MDFIFFFVNVSYLYDLEDVTLEGEIKHLHHNDGVPALLFLLEIPLA
jgi:hypothetical protein